MMTGDWKEAQTLLDRALQQLPEEPLIVSLQGVMHAQTGKSEQALDWMTKACKNPRSFGHAHHTYYQIACILALVGRREAAFEWLERSVGTGFACWPFFQNDPCLQSLRGLPNFDFLLSSLQGKYPDHLGLLSIAYSARNESVPIQTSARERRFPLYVRVTLYSLPPFNRRPYSPVTHGWISSTNDILTSTDRWMRINP